MYTYVTLHPAPSPPQNLHRPAVPAHAMPAGLQPDSDLCSFQPNNSIISTFAFSRSVRSSQASGLSVDPPAGW